MKLDPTKEYQYRNGEKPWRIIWDVPNEDFPIASITHDGCFLAHRDNGLWLDNESGNDLIEVKKKIKGWVNVYPYDGTLFSFGGFCPTRGMADESSMKNRIACIEIEFTEGEGL